MEQQKPNIRNNKIQDGLVLCMLLAALMDNERLDDQLREIALICQEEPEFQDATAEELERALSTARDHLHGDPDQLIRTIHRLLSTPEARQRGLEFAVRVVTANGIVSPEEEGFLETLIARLELPREVLDPTLRSARKRLVRFMILYLVYLTATADGIVRPEEFEEMIPLALNLPVFSGVSTDEFASITHSVRRNLAAMKDQRGLDYITGTLLHASAQLGDESIPEQALRLVARGIFADDQINESEEQFFIKVADRLKVPRHISNEMVPKL